MNKTNNDPGDNPRTEIPLQCFDDLCVSWLQAPKLPGFPPEQFLKKARESFSRALYFFK